MACEIEIYSRVTGFFRPINSWNKGKREEFKERKRFNIEPMQAQNDPIQTYQREEERPAEGNLARNFNS